MRWLKTVCTFAVIITKALGFENLALNKTAFQISMNRHGNVPASKAVDGIIGQRWPEVAATEFHRSVWWYVDLEVPCNIHNVTIYYRTEQGPVDYRSRFAGFSLYISDKNQTSKGGHNCGVNSTYPPITFPVVCMQVGRYVTLYNQRQFANGSTGAILELGEVQVFGCPSANTYGYDCNMQCSSKCRNGQCNVLSGSCFYCIDGHQGVLCDQRCSAGKYGEHCKSDCSTNCANPMLCNNVNGSCIGGCKPGWKGQKCDQKFTAGSYGEDCVKTCSWNCKNNDTSCDPGTFGQNCAFACGNCRDGAACNIQSGLCEAGCGPGYSGLLCITACASGRYGEDCIKNCSGNCLNNATCNTKTGTCDGGCTAGYTGAMCDKICEEGKYGPNCLSTCGYCEGRGFCNEKNGHCLNCIAGYKPPFCHTLSQASSAPQDSQLGVGIAIGIGIVVAIIIAALLGRLTFRKCRYTTEMSKKAKKPDAVYVNDVMNADQLNDSVKNDDYQELSEVSDKSSQYHVVSPSAK